jgi:hypothetical protein
MYPSDSKHTHQNPSQQESKVKGRTHMCLVRCFADWTFDSSPARGGEQPENLRGDEVGGLLYLSIFGSDNFDPSKPGMSSLLKPSPGVGTDVPIAKLNIVYGYVVSAFCIPASYSAESVRVPRLHQLWIPNSVSKNESVVQKVEKHIQMCFKYMAVFENWVTPKWMVYNGKSICKWMI